MSVLQKKSTKERILETAFSFFDKPRFSSLSLGEIAKKMNISKTTIFKHFKNKDALFDEMLQVLASNIADSINLILKNLLKADWEKDISLYRIILRNYVKMFFDNPETLFFSIFIEAGSLETREKLLNLLITEFEKRDLSLEIIHLIIGVKYKGDKCITFDMKRRCSCIYCITTVCFYCLYYFTFFKKENDKNMSSEEFSDKIANILDFGIKKPENQISIERMKEIEKLCVIDSESLPKLNPIFKALTEVINEYGFPGVTVERIASNLGLAKSSLYTYFDTKSSLISSLLTEEIVSMVQNILKVENLFANSSNKTELCYAYFCIISNFFLSRPEVLTVFKWTRMTGKIILNDIEETYLELSKRNTTQLETANFSITQETFFTWLCVISSTLIIQMRHHNWTKDFYDDALRICFDFIQRGLTHEK